MELDLFIQGICVFNRRGEHGDRSWQTIACEPEAWAALENEFANQTE